MVPEDTLGLLPPVQGCLFCHSEGAISLEAGRARLVRSAAFPLIKCAHCGSIAELDVDPADLDHWRIRYRKISHAPRYYYTTLLFGSGAWIEGPQALQFSTQGFVQRQRVRQASEGDFSWLAPVSLDPAPPFIVQGETALLVLRAVSFIRPAPQTWLFRTGQDELLDSGKLYITDRKLHLVGQRREWSVAWADVLESEYDADTWRVRVGGDDRMRQFTGARSANEVDPQLITVTVDYLKSR